MKKLIILSAVVLSSAIYNSTNAQERIQNHYRYNHESYQDQHFYKGDRRDYDQPNYSYERHENNYGYGAHFYRIRHHHENFYQERHHGDNFYQERHHDENFYQHRYYNENSNDRMRR